METSVAEVLYSQVLGWEALRFLREEDENFSKRVKEINSKAVKILEEIRAILDDDTLDDPECFERIDRIVSGINKSDIGTSRHDWG